MEWVGLFVFITVAAVAPLIARCATESPALGVQALAAMLGLVFAVIFLVADGPAWTGWAAAGCAVLGLIADAFGAVWLTNGDRDVSPAGEGAEETNALLIAVQMPLFAVAIGAAVLMALRIATVM